MRLMQIVRTYWIVILIVIVVLIGALYWVFFRKSPAVEKTYTVTRTTLKETLSLSGEIEAKEKATLHFQSGGRLSWVGVKEGDRVKKYQGIASLDTRQLQKTLQKYLNTYVAARNTFDQTTDDNDQLTIALSKDIQDRAKRLIGSGQTSLDNSVIDVELQTIAQEYSYLYSPIDGVVTHVGVGNAGTNIAVTDTYEVINPQSMYFTVTADQTEVVKLKSGMKSELVLDAYPDKKLTAVVTNIAYTPRTDETGTVYDVDMSLSDPVLDGYRIGMTGDAEFNLTEKARVLAVPVEYIIEKGGKSIVTKKVGKTKVETPIVIGGEYDGVAEVTDGLFEGDVIYEVAP